ncbi:MAG: glycosyltransferase family 2 protein [Bacillota bacterium]
MLISIITVCLNSENDISRTILSVINQDFQDFEYIIIDGGSTDKTLEIINRYKSEFNIKLISEPDLGIYDAMNKGSRYSTGKYINFMNAGDAFYDNDVLKKLSVHLNDINDIVYGSTIFEYGDFEVLRKPRNISDYWKKMPFNHQSSFTRRELLLAHPFDIHYRLSADYDFFLQALFNKAVLVNCDAIISRFNNQGLSNKFTLTAIKEYREILKKYNQLNLKTRLYYDILRLKPFFKKYAPRGIFRYIYKNLVK